MDVSEVLFVGRWTSWARHPAREEDWDALYAEQLPRILNFFRYRVADGATAEDLTSLTFEKAWLARSRYRRDLSAFGTWLMAIARNVATDHFRARRPHVPLEAAAEVAGGDNPADVAERRAEFERLGRLLETLAEADRELVALKYGAGMTNRAIAKAIRQSETNVGTRLHRVVQKLRAGWNEGA